MTDSYLTTAKRRADLWRGLSRTDEARDYYHGLRLGLVHAAAPAGDGRVTELPGSGQPGFGVIDADARLIPLPAHRYIGSPRARAFHEGDTVDVTAYARSCGFVDGTRTLTGPQHVGLLRLAILLRADGSARAYAGQIETDERTVRRWLAGDRPIQGVTLALLQREIDRA